MNLNLFAAICMSWRYLMSFNYSHYTLLCAGRFHSPSASGADGGFKCDENLVHDRFQLSPLVQSIHSSFSSFL